MILMALFLIAVILLVGITAVFVATGGTWEL
jgi:hypothetical protein